MDTTQAIGFAAGFAHVVHTSSWWLWLGGIILLLAALWIVLEVEAKKANFDPSNIEKVLLAVTVLTIGCAIFGRAANVGVNTSKAAAAKGYYLGY